jgi:lysophospholipase L1-like esterase
MHQRFKKFLKNVSVITLSLFMVFLFLELIIRLTYEFKFKPKGRANLPISRTYKLAENKHLLYELLPNSRAKINGNDYIINAFGFRDKKYRLRKTNRMRILFVGDSVTYGWGISLDETYHKRLEKLLNDKGYDVDVMGMGIPGYNIVQEYHLIKDRALEFNPDILVLQIVPNDFERTVKIQTFREGKKLTLLPYHDLAIPFVIKKTKLTSFFMQNSHFFKFINLRLSTLKIKQNQDFAPKDTFMLGEEKSFRHLGKINKLLKKNSIQFAVAVFPFQNRKKIYAFASLHEKIHKKLEELQVPFIDLYEELNASPKDDLWIERLHPSAKGHEIASVVLLKFLMPILENL